MQSSRNVGRVYFSVFFVFFYTKTKLQGRAFLTSVEMYCVVSGV